MNERNSQTEKLAKIERELLAAGKMPEAEIEQIISAPQLFTRIRANVEAEKTRRSTKPESIFKAPVFQFWNRRPPALSFAALAILILSAAFFFNFSQPDAPPQITAVEKQTETVPARKQPENSPQIIERHKNESKPPQIAAVKTTTKKQKSEAATLTKPAAKQKVAPKLENQPEEPFVALTYAGNLKDDESHIVRVEMSPARLLALGVAVQTENEAEKIKTDLLVGADGVARAIRLVK